MAMPRKVFLAVPCGADGKLCVGAAMALVHAVAGPEQVAVRACTSSALTFNFNQLWCWALQAHQTESFDAFVMLHSDVAPRARDWLTQLLSLLFDSLFDVLSVTLPIKDDRGLTSTALDTDRWRPRRLTTREVLALPETIGDDHAVARFGAPLLMNTGLWAGRMNALMAANPCFTIDNRIVTDDAGISSPQFEPEDWRLARDLRKAGVRVGITRAIAADHFGITKFPNQQAWGQPVDQINLVYAATQQTPTSS